MKRIHELQTGQCRYVLDDEAPFHCCAEPIERGSYCAEHAKRCFNGYGRDWRALADMIYAVEQTVVRV